MSRAGWMVAGVGVVVVLGAAGAWRWRAPEDSPAARGARIAEAAGCFACHGPAGVGGIKDPSTPRATVPSWNGRTMTGLIRSRDELREWIVDGIPKRLAGVAAKDTKRKLVPMPAYGARLSSSEVDDLVAYVLAVSGWNPELSNAAFEGKVTAEERGCLGCHGPSGMGGVGNPGSLKGHIPAWDGEDFAELVRDDKELKEWILDGRIKRLSESAFARYFLDAQVIQMPAYRAFLSDDELNKIVAYVNALRPAPKTAPAPAAKPVAPAPVVEAKPEPAYKSPADLVLSRDGRRGVVVNQSAGTITLVDTAARRVVGEVKVGALPMQAALSADGSTAYVTLQEAYEVAVVDVPEHVVVRRMPTGDEPQGLVLSRDGRRLYVANYLGDSVSVLDVDSGKPLAEIPVGRGPRFVALSPDGAELLVSNGLGRSVSFIDLARHVVRETRSLGRASILRDVAYTPDGKWAIAAHVLSRDEQVPTQLERGWIHSNGFSLMEIAKTGHYVTLLLDKLMVGAANPYGLAVTPDGKRLYVTISGTQEVAIVDLPRAIALAKATRPEQAELLAQDVEILERTGIARRFPCGGEGPRGLALDANRDELWVGNYFSDSVAVLDAATAAVKATIPVGPKLEMTARRRGELLFTDARITYQAWFTCVSCHEEDAGVDALNWVLPNDGTGNTKNVKSLHDAYDTPPAMWMGVRANLDAATQAGQRFQGFLPMMDNNPALVTYLQTQFRPRNPHRERHVDSVRRGELMFQKARCDTCHPGPKYTDLRKHDLALGRKVDLSHRFDTPSLRECYRTGPYLHDGRAPTLESIWTEHDPEGVHGRVAELDAGEFVDLVRYVKSL